MNLLATLLVAFVALQHVGFLVLESFLVRQPIGQKIFRLSAEHAEIMAPLFANQGLYNGFLAAGLVWGLLHPVPAVGWQLQVFFLSCVVIAGVVGGFTAARSILFVQAVPGLIALAVVWATRAA